MNKLIALASALIALAASSAHADVKPIWGCDLDFQGHAEGVQIIIGQYVNEATGVLRCESNTGERYERNVRLSFQTAPIAPAVGIGAFDYAGRATNIVLAHASPRVLFGEYTVVGGRASLVGGVGAFTALRNGRPEVTVQISLEVLAGLGVEAGFAQMSISRL